MRRLAFNINLRIFIGTIKLVLYCIVPIHYSYLKKIRFGEEGLQGGGGGGGGFGGADPNDIFRMFFGGGEGFIKLLFFLETIIFFQILIFIYFYKNHFDKWSKVAVVLAAVVFLVAEEILIWMISEMMTILGKNISKKRTPTRFSVGSEDLVVPEDSPSVDTPAWEAAGDAVVNEDRKEFDRIHFYRGGQD